MYCCIYGCGNKSADNRHKSAGIQFYSFPAFSSFLPWQNEKRNLWIDAVKRHTKNPDTFKPTRGTRVCSAHFVGNKKSENPHNPAYLPTIFAGKNEVRSTSTPPAPCQPPRVPAASLPEKPTLYEDETGFSVLPSLQVVPIEPFVTVEVDNSCKDCETHTVGFWFWCVQCGRGPLCVSCAECAPHDGHYLLRTPRGATHSQTEAVLAVIRHQLQADNLLTLYEIDNKGVKVEIKEEPGELPPAGLEPDPLDPLATHYPHTGGQVVEGETASHYLSKRRRIMPTENAKNFISQSTVKDTPSGSKTVLKRTPSGLKKVLLKPISSGSQRFLKLKAIPSDSVLKTKLDRLKRSQNVLKATSSKTRKSQTVLKIIPHDPKRKTLLEVAPRETQTVKNKACDVEEPPTNQPGKLKIKRTLLKVPLSELTKMTKSNTLLKHPGGLKTLRKVKPGEILGLDKIQKILQGTAVQQNNPKGQKLHNVLKGFATPLKVTSEPLNCE